LANGLRVVSEKIPGVRSVSLGIWVTVGSRHESLRENGISHFIEHMAFKGTATRSALDIAKTIERGGGFVNAFTGKELTCYYVHVLDERMPEALDILADVLQNSLYEPAEMEKEKQVILDEIRDHEDMPDDVAHENFVKQLYGKHPIGRPILGPPENVKAFNRDDLIGYVQRHYAPKRMVISAAGNIEHKTLVALVSKKLKIKERPSSTNVEKVGAFTKTAKSYARPIQQAHMVLGTRALPYGAKNRFTLSVMNAVLGGGMSSRLFQNIREKHGVAYSIYSFTESLADTGFIGVYLATESAKLEKAKKLVLEEFKSLRTIPLPKAELDGVKTQMKGNIMLGLESVASRMMRLARMEIYLGRYHSLDDVSKQIDAVTPAKIQTLANEILTTDRIVSAIVEPEQKGAKSKTKRAKAA
jgi:predicted Zn-dependent peptidase